MYPSEPAAFVGHGRPPVCSMPPTAPAATAWAGDFPNSVTVPESGRVRPSTISIVVVLPAPFGPRMATVSPGAMARSTERTARTLPYDLDRRESTIPAPAALVVAMTQGSPGAGLASSALPHDFRMTNVSPAR